MAYLTDNRESIKALLQSDGVGFEELLEYAASIKTARVGDGVYLRGLIEYSNVCRKNCFYCGIRRDARCERYTLSDKQVLDAARYALENNFGSIVLQGGENTSDIHIYTITKLIQHIKKLSSNRLGITLSLGEQSAATYRKWFDAGAHRYLLRIETSNERLYRKLHPDDGLHSFDARLKALDDLKQIGYQTGTGVMIGLPFQTLDDLADDLMFIKRLDIDMCGMGPYIVSGGTPLAKLISDKKGGAVIDPEKWRFEMTLKMIALLRIMMPNINIAATTALQAIDPQGRLKAIGAGANVVMPNITPEQMRANYSLYNNKPLSFDSELLEKNIRYGEWGDSKHFAKKLPK